MAATRSVRNALGLAVAVAACALLAPAARADDASVFAAYDARQATELKAAVADYARAARRARRTGNSRASLRAIIRADRRLNEVLSLIGGEVAAQTASSQAGADGRALALREIRAWKRANRMEMAAARAALNRRYGRAGRLIRRANRTMGICFRLGRRAVRRFEAAGLSSPNGAVSDGRP